MVWCFGSNSAVFIVLICLSFFFFASQSNGIHLDSPGIIGEEVYGEVLPWKLHTIRRSLAGENTSLILAQERTRRRDPLNNFKIYTGGWNISNLHYLVSMSFTAAPFFVVGGIWFVLFGLSLCCICLCRCCFPTEPYGYSRFAYALSLILLVFFTVAAIVGCIVLYTGQGKFHNNITHTWNYVIHQANDTAEKLRNVSNLLESAQNIGIESVTLPQDLQGNIDKVQAKIRSASSILSSKTNENAKKIRDVLDGVRLSLIIVAAVMLFLAFLGFVCSIFGLQCLVYSLVIFGWILVAGTFILCGIFLILHNVVADSCISMDQWVHNPTAHTALDDILPCVDNATAQETRLRTKDVIQQVVGLLDSVISNVSNQNLPPQAGPLYFNQSGPLVPLVCNPFTADLTDNQCQPGEAGLSNATEVWKNYVCELSSANICQTSGRLTPLLYEKMVSAVNVSYGLYHYGPFLTDLQDCTFVRETFTDITTTYCPGMERYTKWIYIGLLMVSASVMFSLIFWVIYARERRHRVYTKQFMVPPRGMSDKAP